MGKSKEQMKKERKNDVKQRETDKTPGYGDKKLEGPDRPST